MRPVAACLLAASLLTPRAAPAQAGVPRPLRDFDAYVRRAMDVWRVPGLAVAVVKDDSLVFARGYGVRRLGGADAVTPHTLFANASTTKAFTALAVALLVDEGALDWDDPVTRHLPGFALHDPYATREITVRDLLSHRVGFGDPQYLWYGIEPGQEELLHRLRFVEPESSFRSRYAYNNVTYAAAGLIAARVAGTDWATLLRTRVLVPLGMRETVPRGQDLAGGAEVAQPHHVVGDTLRPIPGVGALVDPVAPAGAMYSNVLDMARWLRFLLNRGELDGRRLVAESTLAELFRPQTVIPVGSFYPTALRTRPRFTAYGLGWFLQDYRGEFAAFHTGSIDGMVAIVGLLPERRLGVVVFANRDHAELRHALMLRVFDAYLGGPARDWSADLRALYDSLDAATRERRRAEEARRVAETHPSLALAAYAGSYADSARGTLVVRLEGGGLVLAQSPFLTADLEHWHYDVFRARWRNAWIEPTPVTFRVGASGTVEAVELLGGSFGRVGEPDGESR